MKRTAAFLYAAAILYSGAIPLAAFTPETVDLSHAHISPAGTGSFLIRDIRLSDAAYSVRIEQGDDGRFRISPIESESDHLAPSWAVWDFATIMWSDDADEIIIDGILYDGEVLRGSFSLTEDDQLKLNESIDSGRIHDTPRVEGILQLVLESETAKRLMEQQGLRDGLGDAQSDLQKMQERLDSAAKLEDHYIDEIESLVKRVEELERINYELEAELEELQRRSGGDSAVADAPQEAEPQLDAELLAEIQGLRREISALREQLAEQARQDSAAEGDVELHDLRGSYAELSASNRELEDRVLRRLSDEGIIGLLRERFSEEVPLGEGRSQLGVWEVDKQGMRQTDPRAMFAKYRLPAPQDARPTLYSLRGRSTGSGWVGYGIHVQASDVELDGYGHGRSLLIWITRDRNSYDSDTTYFQVYTSFDDVDMRMVLHAAVNFPIDELVDLEVMIEPESGYLTAAADGQDLLRYKLFFPVEPGVEVALRSLDTADFAAVDIRTVPDDLLW